MLAYLLARQGASVTLLESHADFDRDFRGDTLHASVTEILDELGLTERLLQIPHAKLRKLSFMTPDGPFDPIDMGTLPTKFPYVVMMPQVDFLNFMVQEARKYPGFRLLLRSSAQELIEEKGQVCGVRYRDESREIHELRATLTVAADGRYSKLRRLSGLEVVETSPPMDVLWFRLPRKEGDSTDTGGGAIDRGKLLILLTRPEEWQLGYVIPKGGYQRLKAEGLPALRESIAEMIPWLADRVDVLQDWKQVALLSVSSNRLKRWHRPGLLMIGDAAHVMSPVGGVGINYAIQDAVVAADVLGGPLKRGDVMRHHLAQVQRERDFPTRFIQRFQSILQTQIVSEALQSRRGFRLPWLVRVLLKLPFFRSVPARIIGFGIGRPHVDLAKYS